MKRSTTGRLPDQLTFPFLGLLGVEVTLRTAWPRARRYGRYSRRFAVEQPE